MEERTSYLIVGAFLLAATVMLVGLTAWFGGTAGSTSFSRYLVLFESDISGLTPGNPVRYLGVDVGQVSSISLMPGNAKTVRVEIDVSQVTPIDAGTFAGLSFQGVTGVAFINLGSQAGEHGPIQATQEFVFPVIPSRNVGIAALLEDTPLLVGRVNEVLDRAGSLLDESNQESVSRTLDNLEALTATLADQREQIASIPKRLDTVLINLDRAVQQLPELLTQVQPDVTAAAKNLNLASERLAALTGHLAELLEENDTEVRSFVSDGLGATPALVADLRQTLRELNKLVSELRDDPSQLVHRPRMRTVSVAP